MLRDKKIYEACNRSYLTDLCYPHLIHEHMLNHFYSNPKEIFEGDINNISTKRTNIIS